MFKNNNIFSVRKKNLPTVNVSITDIDDADCMNLIKSQKEVTKHRRKMQKE